MPNQALPQALCWWLATGLMECLLPVCKGEPTGTPEEIIASSEESEVAARLVDHLVGGAVDYICPYMVIIVNEGEACGPPCRWRC